MGLPANPVHRFFYNLVTSFLALATTILVSIYNATLQIDIVGEERA